MSYAGLLEAKIRSEALADAPRRAEALEVRIAALERSGNPKPQLGDCVKEIRYLERLCSTKSSAKSDPMAAEVRGLRDRIEMLTNQRVERRKTLEAASSSQPGPRARSSDVSIGPIANFLHPETDAEDREDEVRLLSAEGRLHEELSRYPQLSVTGSGSSLLFRPVVRSWCSEDDQVEKERERLAVLELTQAAANLREIVQFAESKVNDSVEPLNEIENQVAATRDNLDQALAELGLVKDTKVGWRIRDWVAIGILGLSVVHPPSGLACKSITGLLALSAANGVQRKWQNAALEQMKGQLPRACEPVPETEAAVLGAAGQEAARRVLSKLADEASWNSAGPSLTARYMSVPLRHRPSDVRPGSLAWSTQFDVSLQAERAFHVLRRLSFSGNMDPGCKVSWSRPVEGQADTFVRYVAYSELIFNRDFFCVCRCGRDEKSGKFVVAIMSLGPELLDSAGLPQPLEGIAHGSVYACGYTVTDIGNGHSLIEVMADLDVAAPRILQTWGADRQVRLYMLHSARLLRAELLREAKVWDNLRASGA